jgi:hypothetical protein
MSDSGSPALRDLGGLLLVAVVVAEHEEVSSANRPTPPRWRPTPSGVERTGVFRAARERSSLPSKWR